MSNPLRDLRRLGRLYELIAGPIETEKDGTIGMVETAPGVFVPARSSRPPEVERVRKTVRRVKREFIRIQNLVDEEF
jgi:hypothetical protein